MLTPTTHNERAVDEIVQSDLVTDRTAKAVITAEQYAEGGPVTIEHCRLAARRLRAKLRVVAAAFGFVRCLHCGENVHVSHEVDAEDFSACGHTLDCECDEQEAALAVYVLLTGHTINPALAEHAAWTARRERFGNERPATKPERRQSPAHDAKAP